MGGRRSKGDGRVYAFFAVVGLLGCFIITCMKLHRHDYFSYYLQNKHTELFGILVAYAAIWIPGVLTMALTFYSLISDDYLPPIPTMYSTLIALANSIFILVVFIQTPSGEGRKQYLQKQLTDTESIEMILFAKKEKNIDHQAILSSAPNWISSECDYQYVALIVMWVFTILYVLYGLLVFAAPCIMCYINNNDFLY